MKNISLLLTLLLCFSATSAQFILNPQVDSIPMRDGKKLAADIHLPDTLNAHPVILIQTPYNRLLSRLGLPLGTGLDISNSDYAFVVVDWRGFYGSFSAFTLNPNRGEDGYDVVEWINSQPWCNGKIGGWGPSALGNIQFQTARQNPPALDCIVPLVASPEFTYEGYFPGGNAREEFINQLDNLGFGLGPLLYANPTYNLFWQFGEPLSYYPDEIPVPTMMIGGWYDHNTQGNIDWFEDMDQMAPASLAGKHRLIMGPWAHGGFGSAIVGSANQGQLTYSGAAGWSDSLALRFFDFHLRGASNAQDLDPKIRYFNMGDDTWTFPGSTDPSTGTQTFYLAPQGGLILNAPTAANGSAALIFDPRDPSPTVGGPTLTDSLGQGPYDQSPMVESRNDVLTFTSQQLQNDVNLTGNAKVVLFVSSDQSDTDFMVRLTDVYPDGRSMLVNTGVQRMRFRNSFTQYSDTIAPGTIYRIEMTLPFTNLTFKTGHQIRLNITSSNYPQYSLNLNNGDSMYVAGDTLIATNEVYYNQVSTSYIEFPNLLLTEAASPLTFLPSLNLYPNPSHHSVAIQSDHPLKRPSQIRVRDIHGKLLSFQLEVSPAQLSKGIHIPTETWPSGMYFIELRSGEQKKVVKLMVQH